MSEIHSRPYAKFKITEKSILEKKRMLNPRLGIQIQSKLSEIADPTQKNNILPK